MTDLVSVLVPCHNASPWLVEAIESISNQTHRALEIIVLDDGSTDNSFERLKSLAAKDARILPIRHDANLGIVAGLNEMLRHAQGKFIARMDADDVSFPSRIERQVSLLKRGDIDLCGTWFEEFGGGIARAVRWPSDADELAASLLFQNSICHPTIVAKRAFFDAFQYREPYRLAEDYDLFVRGLTRYRLANLDEVLLRYRRHPGQATQARRAEMEKVTEKVRLEALRARGVDPSVEEARLHNLIRAPHSIRSMSDFEAIEAWLKKLLTRFDKPLERRAIATQWTRAAVRAAPLGWKMWNVFRNSELVQLQTGQQMKRIDLALLALSRLEYNSGPFQLLRRFGLSG